MRLFCHAQGQNGHLLSDALEGALLASTNATGGISCEGAHWHLIHNQVLPCQVGPLVVGSPLKGRRLKVKGAPEEASLLHSRPSTLRDSMCLTVYRTGSACATDAELVRLAISVLSLL